MTDDEKFLLSEVMSILGQFDGLPDFEELENLRLSVGVRHNSQIVSFTKNPLECSNLFGMLFTAISQKQVIELKYHTFTDPKNIKETNLYPYMLKEYNRRWYLIAAAENDKKMLCFGLERIDDVIPLPSHKYVPYDGNINEYFEDVIGVTVHDDNPVYKIVFWVSDRSKDYVRTKPIHESQRMASDSLIAELRAKYPHLQGGEFFLIECRENYELIRELIGFGKDLLVIGPKEIKDTITERISGQLEEYYKIKNN